MLFVTLLVSATAIELPANPAAFDVFRMRQDTAYSSQTSRGTVTLEVRPAWKDGGLEVHISANTHSVDLSTLDLKDLARLVVGDTALSPESAGALSGHHAETKLLFPLEERPESFAIEIRDVPDVPLRVLKWPEAGL